jgi:hypothetical protein
MNLLLYIQITEHAEEVKFFNPIISKLKEVNRNTIFYDIDNHSEPLIINYAIKLLTESEKKIIFFDTEKDGNFSKLLSLMTNLLDNSEGIEIFIRGNNTKLEKMISILPHFTYPKNTLEIDIIERIIYKFL